MDKARDTLPATRADGTAPSISAIVASLAALGAGWIAAGSTGLLAHPLRHGLVWLVFSVGMVAARPRRAGWRGWGLLVVATVLALGMLAPAMAVYNVLAVGLIFAALARMAQGADRRLLLVTSVAVTILAVYRLAYVSVPVLWVSANSVGSALGRLTQFVTGKRLWIGATFAGLDYLIAMTAVYVGWLLCTGRPRTVRAVYAATAILAAQFAYLFLLSWSVDLRDALPESGPPAPTDPYVPGPWAWTDSLRTILPWNVPLMGVVFQLIVAAIMFRWARWTPPGGEAERASATPRGPMAAVAVCAPFVLAALVPLAGTLSLQTRSLEGKRVVAHDEGYLDWAKPVHDSFGRESAGLYGMLPEFVQSLGGQFARSRDLSSRVLQDADILLLIHPVRPWTDALRERIWRFVRDGGSLLLAAGPHVFDGELSSSFNQLLQPTSMRVRFDVAVSEAGFWGHSREPMGHPATIGIGDARDRFGSGEASSIDIAWPARPILVGRWGWSEPGSDSVVTGVYRLDRGEKLGDLVLAAEERMGRGTVVVLADATGLKNEGISGAYPFVGGLLKYLAGPSGTPQDGWRQFLALALCLALVVLLIRRPDPTVTATVALILAIVLGGCRVISHSRGRVLPDGRRNQPFNNIAYIDDSHLGAHSDISWAFDGIGSFSLNLMRNGYLPLMAPDLKEDRLERAGLLVSIGPARAYSTAERRAVAAFVDAGGTFICMAGGDRAEAARSLLADFGLIVPRTPGQPGNVEPKPMGPFPPVDHPVPGEGPLQVSFFAAWPVQGPPSPWEGQLLRLLIRRPDLVPAVWGDIFANDFVSESHAAIYDTFCRLTEAGRLPAAGLVAAELRDRQTRALFTKLEQEAGAMPSANPPHVEQDQAILQKILQHDPKQWTSEVLVRGEDGLPVIFSRYFGDEGAVVLIGDTEFALNKNLAYLPQGTFSGPYNNAHFWRWLLTYLRGPEAWLPPMADEGSDSPQSASPNERAEPEPSRTEEASQNGGAGVARDTAEDASDRAPQPSGDSPETLIEPAEPEPIEDQPGPRREEVP
jgi:hypothetical protein